MKPLAKTDFFRRSDPFAASFLPPACRVSLRAETCLRAAVRQKRVFCLHARDYFDAGDTFFLLPSALCRGPIACGRGVRREDMTTTGLIYKRYIGQKSSFFEKNDKKSSKMFARFEIMPTFASAITKTVLLSLETNVAKVPTDAGSKSNFEKSFRKSS